MTASTPSPSAAAAPPVAHQGPAALSYGFRPFFLLAALWSVLALVVWLLAFAGRLSIPSALDPLNWHAHEMLFGFAAAAVAGFVLTAVANWTGRPPVRGRVLLFLVLLWLAARLAVLASLLVGGAIAAALDLAFLAALALMVGREIAAARNWRNLPVVVAIAALIVADGLFFREALRPGGDPLMAARLAIAILVWLITLIGGRIIPTFTRNWLVKQGEGKLPAPFDRFDQITLVATPLALAAWVAAPDAALTGVASGVVAVANLVRLARWRGERTGREPLVWILHLAYLWIPVGLALIAAHPFIAAVPATTGVHALTAGAIGAMILAVMTRASLGHTGRALHAGPGTTLIYAAVLLAGAGRVVATLLPGQTDALLIASGAGWVLAFGLFVALYARPLLTPRPV